MAQFSQLTQAITNQNIKAVVFDHDGTLVDSEPVHLEMWRSVITPHSLNEDDYSNYLSGRPTAQSSAWVKEKFNLDLSAEALEVEKKQQLKNYLKSAAFPLMEGALELLDFLKSRGIPLAIASGATTHEVTHSVEFHQLKRYFSHVSTGDMVPNNKPAPDVYLHAAEKLNTKPENCLAIEDSDSGQSAALAAGMVCLRLDTPSQFTSPPSNVHIIQSLSQAQSIMERL